MTATVDRLRTCHRPKRPRARPDAHALVAKIADASLRPSFLSNDLGMIGNEPL